MMSYRANEHIFLVLKSFHAKDRFRPHGKGGYGRFSGCCFFLAVRYGYQRFQTNIMVVVVVLLILIGQLIQPAGDRVVLHYTRRR
jgi:hypothetical protein